MDSDAVEVSQVVVCSCPRRRGLYDSAFFVARDHKFVRHDFL